MASLPSFPELFTPARLRGKNEAAFSQQAQKLVDALNEYQDKLLEFEEVAREHNQFRLQVNRDKATNGSDTSEANEANKELDRQLRKSEVTFQASFVDTANAHEAVAVAVQDWRRVGQRNAQDDLRELDAKLGAGRKAIEKFRPELNTEYRKNLYPKPRVDPPPKELPRQTLFGKLPELFRSFANRKGPSHGGAAADADASGPSRISALDPSNWFKSLRNATGTTRNPREDEIEPPPMNPTPRSSMSSLDFASHGEGGVQQLPMNPTPRSSISSVDFASGHEGGIEQPPVSPTRRSSASSNYSSTSLDFASPAQGGYQSLVREDPVLPRLPGSSLQGTVLAPQPARQMPELSGSADTHVSEINPRTNVNPQPQQRSSSTESLSELLSLTARASDVLNARADEEGMQPGEPTRPRRRQSADVPSSPVLQRRPGRPAAPSADLEISRSVPSRGRSASPGTDGGQNRKRSRISH